MRRHIIQPATPKARRRRSSHISTRRRATTPILLFFVMTTTAITMLTFAFSPSAVHAFLLSPSYSNFHSTSQRYVAHHPLSLSSLWNEQEQPSTSSTRHHTQKWAVPPNANILNTDPLIYTIPNLLSQDECQAYLDYVDQLVSPSSSSSSSQPTRTMTRSNPPQVSLDLRQLWPLPFLSMGAGLPNLIKLLLDHSSSDRISIITPTDILDAVQLPIGIALLVSLVLVILAQPVVQWIISNNNTPSAARRTSEAMALNQIHDIPQISNLVQRVQDTTGHVWELWEAPVVTRYDVGAIFAPHGDASPQKGAEWMSQGGQRVITCICYLNTIIDGGGETYFEKLGIAVQPKAGTALVFFPADSNTLVADGRTLHESLAPKSNEKWIVQLFGRIDRVPPPLGIPDEYEDYLQSHNNE